MIKHKQNYFNHIRTDLIEMVDGRNNVILDIGCGEGVTGSALKKSGKAQEVVGIEIIPNLLEQASRNIDKIIIGNVEIIELDFSQEYFDYILCGDVLEHLHKPEETLVKIKPFLKKNGYIIISLPNIRNWRIIFDLLIKGEWNYIDEGILDKTHLRFFTKKSIISLLEKRGFSIEEIRIYKKAWSFKLKLINLLTFRIFEDFLANKYIVKAKKVDL